MPKQKRRMITPGQKMAILKEHLQGKIPISDLCKKHNIQPRNIYDWQHQLFKEGEVVFERKNDRKTGHGVVAKQESKINELEKKLVDKNEVIGELMEEYIKVKKQNGAT